ncbi:minor tail protein [Mycobacterium phage LilSpotty]|uniref:Minor tail protein n=1 Tax=Mycobacterium phage LilSpotty TaxID=2588512 RepID=A0A4Y6EM38_9CAUD|nr:minor tail protein [Mycobacterium phage LilSpotty]QDF19753.1 minor tail protein [Mycobacterium phage LilSpotty]
MSMNDDFQTLLIEAFTDAVDSLSLHTADPGTTGANDSAVPHAPLVWSTPVDGTSSATASLTGVTGDYTHVGLWDGETFRMGIECPVKYSAPADVAIMVTHSVEQTTVTV